VAVKASLRQFVKQMRDLTGATVLLTTHGSPLIALVVAAVALGIWRGGLRRYQSTGS
jgi:ABC-type uncharacterized transport system permease subunit